MLYLLFIFIALLPGIFWLVFYRRKDKEEPEPRILVLKVFFWGMVATLPAVLLELLAELIFPYSENVNLAQIFWGTFVVVAPVEEFLKYLVIKWRVYQRPEFDQRLDGIIYGTIAGIGFASLENVFAALGSAPATSEVVSIIALRFLTATLMHTFATGIVGYYVGRARFNPQREKALIARGLIIAILIHGAYNFVITLGVSAAIPFIIFILLGGFITLNQLIKYLKRRRAQVFGPLKIPPVEN